MYFIGKGFEWSAENKRVIGNNRELSLCALSRGRQFRNIKRKVPGAECEFPLPWQWRWWRWAHHCRRAGGVRTECCCVPPSPTTPRSPETTARESAAAVSSPSPRHRDARLSRFRRFPPWPRRRMLSVSRRNRHEHTVVLFANTDDVVSADRKLTISDS